MNKLLINTIFILKINIKHLPFITFARFIGFLNKNVSGIIRAFIVGLIIDWVIKYINDPNSSEKYLTYSLLTFGAFYLLNGAASILRNYGENLVGFQMNYAIPLSMLHEKLNKLSNETLEDPKIQNWINRYQENRYVFYGMSNGILHISSLLISLVIAVIPLATILPFTTFLLIIAAAPSLILSKKMINLLWKLDKDNTVLTRKAGNIVHLINSPDTLKEIRLLSAYNYLKAVFDNYVSTHFGGMKKIYFKWSIFDIFINLINMGVILFGIYQLIDLAQAQIITIGQITFFLGAITSINGTIDTISAHSTSYAGKNDRLNEMRELLEYEEDKGINLEDIEILTNPPAIEINNMSFKYRGSNKYVIKDLNLKIKPGEKIAIVGANGAGKTTLVKLISNVYEPNEGEITINNKNLKEISPKSWFENIGVLYQDYNTYPDLTVFENIALGRINNDFNYKEIREAAKKADAHDFIMDYEDNYSQILSEKYEGGIRPSTGQWQKIAIARFFYRNAPVLILDEPTASIDAVAEANIFNRIYKFIENKTVIIISHRFSTVRNADRIIVFDKGQILEEGSHDELMSKQGKYAEAFKLQAEGYKS